MNQILSTEVYEERACVETFIIDLCEDKTESYEYATASLVVPTQSETGFGYIIGDPISSYACSQELVDDGVYQYRGINLYNTSNPDGQTSFRNKVDELIDLEKDIKELTDAATLGTVVTVILYCFASPAAMATNLTALGLATTAEAKSIRAGTVARECGEKYSQLFPYRSV